MYELLKQHPHCYVPVCKDIYFFDRYYSRGMDWYLSFFKEANAEEHIAVGELCHHYLFSATAAERIQTHLPNMKLVVCLRHPVERAFSHYLFMIRSGRTKESFETVLQNYSEVLHNSFYADSLKAYQDRFPAAQLKILWFDDLQKDATSFARELFEFLSVPFIPTLPYEQRVLAASQPRNFLLAKLAKRGASLARDLGLTDWVGRFKHSTTAKLLYRPYRPEEKPKISWETACKLLDLFQNDIESLAQLTGVDLSDWLSMERLQWMSQISGQADAQQLPRRTDRECPAPTRITR
jgi:hypothetical protein